jgi:hypothetical protein
MRAKPREQKRASVSVVLPRMAMGALAALLALSTPARAQEHYPSGAENAWARRALDFAHADRSSSAPLPTLQS